MPIEPADIVTVDTNVEGDDISLFGLREKKIVACTKFNVVEVNGSDSTITIKGACRKITVNGHRNKITAEATTEIVINGGENSIKYSRFVNGRRPTVTENRPGSVVEKISAPAAK